MTTRAERFVVKVQSQQGGNTQDSILIYNEDQSLYHIEEDPASVRAMRKALNGHAKAYFNAYLNEEEKLVIEGVAEWQPW